MTVNNALFARRRRRNVRHAARRDHHHARCGQQLARRHDRDPRGLAQPFPRDVFQHGIEQRAECGNARNAQLAERRAARSAVPGHDDRRGGPVPARDRALANSVPDPDLGC